jgi:UDP-N-acetylmuramate--alanine ligase
MNATIKPLPISKTMSLQVGTIHLVGIGGIGISGIAEILHNLGYQVQGSDIAENANVLRLREMGISVHVGHKGGNVENASVVVKSTAVKKDNPEIIAARDLRIPVVRRSEMLAELMRLKMSIAVAGTHGKTTTTSLLASLFEAAERKPTVINGGIINAYGTNARLGSGEWMIVEADESDGTFIKLPASIGVVTNIDPEHLDYYGDFETLKAAFYQFIENIPFYGFAVLCIDHPEVQKLVSKVTDRRVITYGLSPQADVKAVNVTSDAVGQNFDVEVGEEAIEGLTLPMHGKHNLQNALAAVAVAKELNMNNAIITKALSGFGGVKRRFTLTGEVNGIRIIDDYGHHPVEIAATLSAARNAADESGGRVIAVVQPHRYTRLRDLFDEFCQCFNDADSVIVADVYEAGESPIKGYDKVHLVEGLKQAGHKHAETLESPEHLADVIAVLAQPKDYVICLGAGNITAWANALPEQLETLFAKKAG